MSMPGLVAMWATQSETFYRPVSRAGSMGTGQTNAYDNTAGAFPGITTTSCTMTSSGINTITRYETYTFSGASAYTKFKVYLTCDWETIVGIDWLSELWHGLVTMQYSLDGTTWSGSIYLSDGIDENGSYSYAIPFDLGTFASTTITNFKVRVAVRSTSYDPDGSGTNYLMAQASITMKDVYIGASN